MKKIYFKKNKGSALLTTLLISLILTSLIVTIVTVSLRNLQMASKSMNSNSEYYELEVLGEEVLTILDRVLADADADAIEYVSQEKYKIKELDDKSKGKLMSEENHKMFYEKWDASPKDDAAVSTYISEITERVWGSMIEKSLVDVNSILSSKYLNKVKVQLNTKNGGYAQMDSVAEWAQSSLSSMDIHVDLKISEKPMVVNEPPEGSRYIVADLIPTAAQYGEATQKRIINNGVKCNPIWSNALLAGKEVKFEDSIVDIKGDVISVNEHGGNMEIEGKDSAVNIYGNLLTKGTVEVEKNSTLKININNVADSYKPLMYETNTYVDIDTFKTTPSGVVTVYQCVESVNQGSTKPDTDPQRRPEKPLLFDDSKGGNGYVGSFKGSVSIAGNLNTEADLNTLGDIKTDGVKIKYTDRTIQMYHNNAPIPTTDTVTIHNVSNNMYTLYETFDRRITELGFKTKNKAGIRPDVFEYYMDKSQISNTNLNQLKDNIVKIPSGTLTLGSGKNYKGILYSEGDLTISGDGGSFSGAIICKGDIIFKDAKNIKINYDEAVIKGIIRDHREEFDKVFKKGEKGKILPIADNDNVETITVNPNSRICIKRQGFDIKAWRQNVK
ncbi:MAG: hypothetical protein RSB70_00170 [Clostridium sp.]